MYRLTRVLLALTVVAGLIPVAAIAAPEAFNDVWPWSSDAPEYSSSLLARSGRHPATPDLEQRSVRDASDLTCAPPACETQTPPEDNKPPSTQSTLLEEDPNLDDGPAETTRTITNSSSASETSTTSTTTSATSKPPSTTSTPSTTTEESTSNETVAQGSLTGTVCPCTVTGTVELKGQVSLKGDLVVKGGTLIARPGVALDGNGFQIMFTSGGKADFQGSKVPTWSDRGATQNLKRDINFRNLRRIVWMGGGPSVLKYFTISDSGTPALGDYPLHWHINGDLTRGTIVEGVVVLNGANHAFVPHGSHGITFKDTIAKNTKGDAFWWDPPGTNEDCSFQKFCTLDNSNDIDVIHALVDGVSNGPGDSRGFVLTGFLLGAGSGNAIRNSVAINVSPSHVKNCSGFHWPESANQNTGGNVWRFEANYSHSPSGCHGIFVWQNDGGNHVIDGFSGGGIDHGAYSNKYLYRNINVPYLEVHAAGWRAEGGKVGIVQTYKHNSDASPHVVLEDVTIDRFIVNNGQDGGEIPGTYVLNGTGLECGDVEYLDVVPGTEVLIDGAEC